MALRFFRRIRLAPGLSLNLSKGGGSLSFGPPGYKYTAGTAGTRRTVGLPGTGLYYTERGGHSHKSRATTTAKSPAPPVTPAAPDAAERLDLGFFKRLFTPDDEKHFVDGMQRVIQSDDAAAIATLDSPDAVADALFMAGMLTLKAQRYTEALALFDRAEADPAGLGACFAKYGVSAHVHLPITEHITAIIEPDTHGMALARAEAEQARENWQAAIDALEPLYAADPDDRVVILSLAEILIEEQAGENAYKRVVELTQGTANHSQLEAAIGYWKGRALHRLNLLTAARDALTTALRRKKDRDPDLLRAIQYERALVYDALGQHSRAHEEFGRIYADDPNYEDVAKRID